MTEKQEIRRRYPRVIVGGKIKGRVFAMYEASLLNISLGGALIENGDVLCPGAIISLSLDLQGRRANVHCRVIRSAVHGTALQPGGERALIYHTGVEFLDPSEEMRQVISGYVQSIARERNESSAERRLREELLNELEGLHRLVNAAWRTLKEGTTPAD
jgi:hypothetical protein